jgi:predicted anti-sigma-YlaC factor YlaD
MLNCRHATQLLSEAQERKLGPYEALSLKMHVMMCSACRNFGDQMQALRHFARAYARGESRDDDKQ